MRASKTTRHPIQNSARPAFCRGRTAETLCGPWPCAGRYRCLRTDRYDRGNLCRENARTSARGRFSLSTAVTLTCSPARAKPPDRGRTPRPPPRGRLAARFSPPGRRRSATGLPQRRRTCGRDVFSALRQRLSAVRPAASPQPRRGRAARRASGAGCGCRAAGHGAAASGELVRKFPPDYRQYRPACRYES